MSDELKDHIERATERHAAVLVFVSQVSTRASKAWTSLAVSGLLVRRAPGTIVSISD